jgi:transposase-like protein
MVEKLYLAEMLRLNGNNVRAAANAMGRNRQHLYTRLRKHGIPLKSDRKPSPLTAEQRRLLAWLHGAGRRHADH